MADVLTVQDLEAAKKHDTFHGEVITGKAGAVASGADIETATNAVTGQVQATLPKVLRDVGFKPASFNFVTGGTIGLADADKCIYNPAPAGDDNWYSFGGNLPHDVAPGTNPIAVGSGYVPRTDVTLRSELVTGAMTTRGALLSLRDFVSVKDFGAIGDGLSHPLSSIFSTLSAAQSVYPIATSLTQEIDFIAGQTANNYCYAKGGGAVYWPAGHYIGSGYDGITLRSFVSNFGEGYASFLDFNWNAMKTEGVWGGAVTSADWKNISSINGRFITLTSPSDAAIFSAYVDKLVMLRSAAMDATYHTSFYETVKVKSVNTITGVVELYDTIKDAVVSPQLAVSSYDLVQCVEVYGLRLRSSQPTVNMPFYVDGIYKSHIHDLWLEGAHGLAWNAVTKCSVHDIFCTVYAGSTNYDNLAIEIKYGSYDSSFDRIFVDIINTDNTTELMNMIDVGERSRDIRINGVTINASDCNADLYGQNKAVRTNVKNVTAYLQNSRRVLSVYQSSGGGSLNSNSNFSDFEVHVSGVFGAGVIFDGGAPTESDIHAKRIHIYGQQGLYGGKDYGSIFFGNVTDRCSVENANIQGKYTDYGSNNSVIECSYSGPANNTTRLKQSSKRCTTKYGAFVAQTKTIVTNLLLGTTANYVVSTIPIVVGFPYIAGDRFSLRARGFIYGDAGAKTLLITSTDGDFFSSTIAAGTNAAFILDVDAIILNANTTNITLRVSGSLTVGSTITPVDYLRNITTTSAKTLMFEAWKAASADTLTVYRSEISFIENGE